MAKQKKPVHRVQMAEGKRNIIVYGKPLVPC